MSTLKVGITQFALRPEADVATFLDHVAGLVAAAAADDVELLVLPELASTGLLASITDHTVTTETVSSDYWKILPKFTEEIASGLSSLAARHGLVIVGGSHNRLAADGTLRNTAYVSHPDGRVETQDKIHLTPQEHQLGAKGGDELLVTRVGPFTAGLLICADIQFPELSRYLVGEGVDLIISPSLTWNRRGVHRVRTGCQARAIENQLFVLMAPLVGHSGLPVDAPMYAVGKALVTTPVDRNFGLNDGILQIGMTDGEETIVTTLDRDRLLASRAEPEAPGLSLRRLDLYDRLTAGLTDSVLVAPVGRSVER
jgi:predicted amidohydrolase